MFKKRALCPECREPQKVDNFYELTLHSVSKCTNCGTKFKAGKFSIFLGAIFGSVATVLFLFVDPLFKWSVVFGLFFAMIPVGYCLAPYFTTLKRAEESQRVKFFSRFFRRD